MRQIHKTALKQILQTVNFRGAALTVETYNINSDDHFPYVFVTSGPMESISFTNVEHKRLCVYEINCVASLEDNTLDGETMLDELEDLIIDAVDLAAVGDNNKWLDIRVTGSTDPFQYTDNSIIKAIKIQIINIKSTPQPL